MNYLSCFFFLRFCFFTLVCIICFTCFKIFFILFIYPFLVIFFYTFLHSNLGLEIFKSTYIFFSLNYIFFLPLLVFLPPRNPMKSQKSSQQQHQTLVKFFLDFSYTLLQTLKNFHHSLFPLQLCFPNFIIYLHFCCCYYCVCLFETHKLSLMNLFVGFLYIFCSCFFFLLLNKMFEQRDGYVKKLSTTFHCVFLLTTVSVFGFLVVLPNLPWRLKSCHMKMSKIKMPDV